MLKLIENISLKIGLKNHILYFSIIFSIITLNLPYDLLGKERSTEFVLNYISPFSYLWLILGILSIFISGFIKRVYSLKIYFNLIILNTFITICFFSNFFISFLNKESLSNSFLNTIYFLLPLSIFSFLYYISFYEYIKLLVKNLDKNKK